MRSFKINFNYLHKDYMSRLQSEIAKQVLLYNSKSQSRLRVPEHKKRKASNSFDQSSCKIENLDQTYQREMHKNTITIAKLQQKIKKVTHQCEQFQSKSKQLQLSLDFYKIKLREECQRNRSYEQGVEVLSATINAQLNILKRLLEQDQQSPLAFSDQQSSQEEHVNAILKPLRLIKKLQIELDKLQISMLAKKKQPNDVQRLCKSMNATLELTKTKYERQRQLLKKEIDEITTKYEEKVAESQDYKQEISNLLKQRAYTNELLICSEKQKISIVNDIYNIAKAELNHKLHNMAKSDLILLCLQLFARLKDLEVDRKDAQILITKLEAESTTKYSSLLRQLKSIDKSPKKQANRLRKMKSMPAE